MIARRLAVLVALAAALALSLTAVGQSRSVPTLKGVVGPGFTITLKAANGKKVKALGAGKYRITVSDKASIHDFTIEQESGGTFEKQLTTDPFTGSKTVTLTLRKGKWKYYCVAHESVMFGFFTVK